GGVGVLTCASFRRPETRLEVELIGEGWSLSFEGSLASLQLVERDRTTTLRRLNSPAADHAAAFLEAVASCDPTRLAARYAESLRTVEVCRAAILSAQAGRPVAITELQAGSEIQDPRAPAARPGTNPGEAQASTG